jgi:hypothetical protein
MPLLKHVWFGLVPTLRRKTMVSEGGRSEYVHKTSLAMHQGQWPPTLWYYQRWLILAMGNTHGQRKLLPSSLSQNLPRASKNTSEHRSLSNYYSFRWDLYLSILKTFKNLHTKLRGVEVDEDMMCIHGGL